MEKLVCRRWKPKPPKQDLYQAVKERATISGKCRRWHESFMGVTDVSMIKPPKTKIEVTKDWLHPRSLMITRCAKYVPVSYCSLYLFMAVKMDKQDQFESRKKFKANKKKIDPLILVLKRLTALDEPNCCRSS